MDDVSLSKAMGVSRQAVSYWRRKGCPYSVGRKGQLSYDLNSVLAWRCENLAPPHSGPARQAYERSKATLEHYRAQKSRLDFLARKSQLIHRSTVEHAFETCVRQLTESVMALPGRLAPVFSLELDEKKIHAMFTREIRAALEPGEKLS